MIANYIWLKNNIEEGYKENKSFSFAVWSEWSCHRELRKSGISGNAMAIPKMPRQLQQYKINGI